MPRGANPKREREYDELKRRFKRSGRYKGREAEVAARITEHCFYSLEAPVLRVGGFDTPYPPSRIEEDFLPDLDRVLDAVDRTFDF